jgi:predicted metal-binding protein
LGQLTVPEVRGPNGNRRSGYPELNDNKTGDVMVGEPTRCDLKPLLRRALQLGATAAALIRVDAISVEEGLARLCREPQCQNFGRSLSCPPHVGGPEYFRRLQRAFRDALVVKIDVPTAVLLSDERVEVMGLLHGVVSGVERSARSMGFEGAAGFAGGACKRLFCADHRACRALSERKACRHPETARPSMSGFGINVSRLMQAAGWSGETIVRDGIAEPTNMSWVAGLVMVR